MTPVRARSSRRTFLGGAASIAGAAGLNPWPGMAARAAQSAAEAVVFQRGDARYEAKRASLVWQAIKPPRFPARIVDVASEDDVVVALAGARRDKRRVSIVSCGHSYVGNGVCDDAVLIHLGNLYGVTIEAPARIATVQPGVRALAFDAALQQQGLAFPVAHNPGVGMAGFLLGGGMGWNAESWNDFACYNLRAVDAVLASGEKVTIDAEHHPDLFWAARGGGPCFPAVATRFHLNVFERPAAIRESTYVYTIDAAPAVMAWMDKAHAVQSPKVELTLIFATSDPAQTKGEAQKQCIVAFVCFADSEAEAQRLFADVTAGAPTQGLVYKEEQAPRTIRDLLLEDKASIPTRHAVETVWTRQPEAAVRIAAQQFLSSPTPTTLVYANYRARQTLPGDGAYSATGSAFLFSDVSWTNAEDDEANRRWSDDFVSSFSTVDEAAYISETEIVRHPDRARHCFSLESWRRLDEVARRYDPDRLFISPLNP